MASMSRVVAAVREAAEDSTLEQLCSRTVALLKESSKTYDWVGIYYVCGRNLNLGPYLGAPTEHERIPIGEGICGAAAAEGATIVVPDVTADSRYIACSIETKSEIVVPVQRGGMAFAEIDIDSHTANAFNDKDRKMLEEIAEILAAKFWGDD